MGSLLILSTLLALNVAVITSVTLFASLHQPALVFELPVNNTHVEPPFIVVNDTTLAEACALNCHGGECYSTSNITYSAQCISCGGTGYTLSPTDKRCYDTSVCSQYPWCSTSEATTVASTHTALVHIAFNVTVPYPYNYSNATDAFIPILGTTDIEVVDLLNLYVVPAAQYGYGAARTVNRFWDDEGGIFAGSFLAYNASLPIAFRPYVTALKGKLCSQTWTGADADCKAPT